MTGGAPDSEGGTVIECRFLRGRNALLVAADFEALFVDYYLHLGQIGVAMQRGADEKLKLTLVALALYAAARPRADTVAWTLHFEEEELNVFAVADNPEGRIIGQVFTDNVRACGGNVLHAEMADAQGTRRRSMVDFAGTDVFHAAEEYHRQSEQRTARFFTLGGDAFAGVVAQPDCDLEWLLAVGADEVRALAEDKTCQPLERRMVRFFCGCSPERVADAIRPAMQTSLDEIFGDDDHITVGCPRCGLRHEIPRGLFEERPPA